MSKSLVQEQFGANAANYVTSGVHAKGASLQRLVDLVAPKADWQALDIATGGGHTALAFAPHVAHVIASDLTPQMLEQVEGQVAERGLSNVSTQIADAEALPFEGGSFELVTCRIAPHHFPEIPKFVAEVARVLKPGGTFALVDNAAPDALTNPGLAEADLVKAAETYNLFEKIRDPSHNRAWTATEWLGCVETAGFSISHTEFLPKKMSFRTWIKNMSVPADKVPELMSMLETAEPAFAAYVQPHGQEDGDTSFMIAELLLIANKIS
jgi:ubiquinone/menaquinone biosynthesis C-methylase UbiE